MFTTGELSWCQFHSGMQELLLFICEFRLGEDELD